MAVSNYLYTNVMIDGGNFVYVSFCWCHITYILYVLVHSVACELVQDKTDSKSAGIL